MWMVPTYLSIVAGIQIGGEREIQRVDDSHGMALHFYVVCICRRSSLIVCLVAHSATRYDMIWYGVAWATMIDILHSPEYFC